MHLAASWGEMSGMKGLILNHRTRLYQLLMIGLIAAFLSGCCGNASETPSSSGKAANQPDRGGEVELLFVPTLPASAQNPAFSPDGRFLLFTLFHEGYNQGPAGIYKLSLEDGTVVPLLDEPDQDSVNLPGSSWNAPTGLITFASDREDIDEVWTMTEEGDSLFRVTRHDSRQHFIEPSFSPDGQWIVFEVDTETPGRIQQGSVWKVASDGSGLTQLSDGTGGGIDDRQPNWSPVGDRILFQRRLPPSEDWDLYTMSTDGEDVQKVTGTPSSDTDASWSPDGRWIIYSSDYGNLTYPNIFIIQAEGGEPIRVTKDDNREHGAPSWSPDGQWIAFEAHVEPDEDSPTVLMRTAGLSWRMSGADPIVY